MTRIATARQPSTARVGAECVCQTGGIRMRTPDEFRAQAQAAERGTK